MNAHEALTFLQQQIFRNRTPKMDGSHELDHTACTRAIRDIYAGLKSIEDEKASHVEEAPVRSSREIPYAERTLYEMPDIQIGRLIKKGGEMYAFSREKTYWTDPQSHILIPKDTILVPIPKEGCRMVPHPERRKTKVPEEHTAFIWCPTNCRWEPGGLFAPDNWHRREVFFCIFEEASLLPIETPALARPIQWTTILAEDECAPDAREYFSKEFKETFKKSIEEFKVEALRIDDEMSISWVYGVYRLLYAADDPFYKFQTSNPNNKPEGK